MTPIEETIQRLMEPDKHGEKGEPTRTAFGSDSFGHPVQRTLDALWKFAEGTALAARDNRDYYDSAVARIGELEACLAAIKRDPKLWKSGGAGGQDQFAGLPPALRLIHEVLPD